MFNTPHPPAQVSTPLTKAEAQEREQGLGLGALGGTGAHGRSRADPQQGQPHQGTCGEDMALSGNTHSRALGTRTDPRAAEKVPGREI